MNVQKQVSVAKELSEVGDALVGITESIKAKMADGLTPAEIAAALTENVSKMMVAFEGADKIGTELSEDPASAAMAGSVMGGQIIGIFLKKPVAPVPAPSA